jgi:hypothetical protein
MNIPWFFGATGLFSSIFLKKSAPFGGKIVPLQKNFRNTSHQSY